MELPSRQFLRLAAGIATVPAFSGTATSHPPEARLPPTLSQCFRSIATFIRRRVLSHRPKKGIVRISGLS
jgi:hypothetical protein